MLDLLTFAIPFLTAAAFAVATVKAWRFRWVFHFGQILAAALAGPLYSFLIVWTGLVVDPGDNPAVGMILLAYFVFAAPLSLLFYLAALGAVKTWSKTHKARLAQPAVAHTQPV